MRSSTFAASESYFTIASWFAKETSASLTPFTFSSADCTAEAQEPQVIPLISSVTVSSLASALGEKTSPLVSTTKAANNALRCISHLPRGIISPRTFGRALTALAVTRRAPQSISEILLSRFARSEWLPISPDNARLSAFQLEWLIKRHSNCRNLAEAVDKYYGVKGPSAAGNGDLSTGIAGAQLRRIEPYVR